MGDDLILGATLHELRRTVKDANISILSNNPYETEKRHGGEVVLFSLEALSRQILLRFLARFLRSFRRYLLPIPPDAFRRLITCLRNTDLFLSLGGGYLNDYSMFLTHFRLAELAVIGLLRRPLILYAHEIGPLHRVSLRALARLALKFVTYASVRDESSFSVLADLGVARQRLALTADAGWLYEPRTTWQRKTRETRDGLVIALSLMPFQVVANVDYWKSKKHLNPNSINEELTSKIVACLDFLPDRVKRIAFLSMSSGDIRLAKRLQELLGQRVPVDILSDLESQYSALAISDILVGMRMHAIVMAAQMNVPPVALALLPKMRDLMNALGLSENVAEAFPFETARYRDTLLRTLRARDKIRELLNTRVADLRERAGLSTRLVRALPMNRTKTTMC